MMGRSGEPSLAQVLAVIRAAGRSIDTAELARTVGVGSDKVSMDRLHYRLRTLEQRGLVEVERPGPGRGHHNVVRVSGGAQ